MAEDRRRMCKRPRLVLEPAAEQVEKRLQLRRNPFAVRDARHDFAIFRAKRTRRQYGKAGMSVKTLTLSNPGKSNALSAPVVDELLESVQASYTDGTQTLVFTAEGKN